MSDDDNLDDFNCSEDDHCYGIDDNDSDSSEIIEFSEKPYTVLKVSDIKRRQNKHISHVMSVLFVDKHEASILLCHYKWNASQLLDNWFGNEETVRNKVGLLVDVKEKKPKVSKNGNICGICFEEKLSISMVRSASCGDHYYCKICWNSYITTSINDTGPGCLTLRCPDPSCPAVVGQNMINELTSKKYKQKYSNYFTRSYVELKEDAKWCPAPRCDRALELEHGGSCEEGVQCDCLHCFCWECSEEPHRPVECKVVEKWIAKSNSEAENTTWILAYTKPCPKCKRPIEKNHGCSHMTCSAPCSYHFCWTCLVGLDNHTSCNSYYSGNEEKRRDFARQSIIRYTHYYERWASNHKSRQKAIDDLKKWQTIQLPLLGDRVSEPVTQLEFIVKSWKQIVECRRVLKWTYAYGYFLLEHDHVKRRLFEYLQGEAENGLERLHHCTEIELSTYFLGEIGDIESDEDENRAIKNNFRLFRKKLTRLTKVTGTYFENLVKGLENGLSEVESRG